MFLYIPISPRISEMLLSPVKHLLLCDLIVLEFVFLNNVSEQCFVLFYEPHDHIWQRNHVLKNLRCSGVCHFGYGGKRISVEKGVIRYKSKK